MRLSWLLMAAWPAAYTPLAEAQTPSASAPQEALASQLDRIERSLSARPRTLEAPLLALQALTAAGSDERLRVLMLRGHAAAIVHDRSIVEAVLAQLVAWPNAASHNSALLAQAP